MPPLLTMEPLMPVVAMEVGRGLLEGADRRRTGRGGPLPPDMALPGREAVLVFSRDIPGLRILEGVADLEPDHSPLGITMVGTRSVLRR